MWVKISPLWERAGVRGGLLVDRPSKVLAGLEVQAGFSWRLGALAVDCGSCLGGPNSRLERVA
jgi:hypothetical protein